MSSKPKASPEKWYGVQVGHNPGVYTDYDEVKRQIRGYPGSKQQRFSTREEAQAFVDSRDAGSSASLNATNSISAAPSIKEDIASEISLRPSMATSTRKTPKAADTTTSKKQKKNDGTPAAVYLPNGEIEPGTGPLPEDAEDGFDRRIKLNPETGTIEYKTEEELNARKWQPTGDFSGPMIIYTDGAAPNNGYAGAVAGIGVYFGPGNPNNVAAPLGAGKQTNQRAELAAIKRAIDILPINTTALIRSDSHYAIQCVTEWFVRWERNDWKTAGGKNVDNRDLIEPILERIREREMAGARTRFEWVKGHASERGNVEADRLAVRGAEMGRRLMAERAIQEAAQVASDKEEGLEQVGEEDEWAFIKTLQEHEGAAGGA
ncbi:ribonuclease H-like protein [Westerdykella ornata]|uniref:ribonuclease H n=1 Tax=Westerdykella ornata TaxID=318751 RepID=A0A6A6J5Q6_WESOR|nr:ribonuclease H-like protein [Westerdykella ornata]KAF2271920.1 ribonuclease H-like protein [Westerdykella ornata]